MGQSYWVFWQGFSVLPVELFQFTSSEETATEPGDSVTSELSSEATNQYLLNQDKINCGAGSHHICLYSMSFIAVSTS